MLPILILSPTDNALKREVKRKQKELAVDPWNILAIHPEPSIGIEKIRELRKAVRVQSSSHRLIVLHHIETTTIEAQNALLKLLEEPPGNTTSILWATNESLILPTVVSRCQVIRVYDNTEPQNNAETHEFLMKLLESSAGQRMKMVEKYTDKECALQLIRSLSSYFTAQLSYQASPIPLSKRAIADCIRRTEMAILFLSKNVNVRATLDLLFIGLPKLPAQ